MSPRDPRQGIDLRGFRWKLAAVERRLDGEVEAARLALARLQQQARALARTEQERATQRCEHEARAHESARRDVLAGARAMRFLAHLEAERVTASAVRAEAEERVAAAREQCAQRQSKLESVQALRAAAEREHAQEQLRRACKEADAACLARAPLRRARMLQDGEGAS